MYTSMQQRLKQKKIDDALKLRNIGVSLLNASADDLNVPDQMN